jgi:hypothetical protein
MACIQSIEKDARLRAAYFSYNDPVRSVAKGSLKQVSETDLALMGIELGFGRDDLRLFYIQFGDIFEDLNIASIVSIRHEHCRGGTG